MFQHQGAWAMQSYARAATRPRGTIIAQVRTPARLSEGMPCQSHCAPAEGTLPLTWVGRSPELLPSQVYCPRLVEALPHGSWWIALKGS